MKKIIILTFSALICLTVSAQNRRPEGGPDKGQRPGFEQIESMKVAFFTSELDLSPEEATTFWPIYNRYSKELREKGHDTHEAFRAMEEAARNDGKSDIEYKKLVDSYLDAKIKEDELIRLYSSEFYKVLSPEKVAKMFAAEEHFRFKMIEMWRSNGPQGPRPEESGPHKQPEAR